MRAAEIDTLAAGVRERARGNPLDRVEAALAVGAELAASADELIGTFVSEARQAGCSWTEIGSRMGVSKQAARQRFTEPVSAPRPSALEREPRLLACLASAGEEAAADGAAAIGTHHLLVGLFAEGLAAGILEQLGVRADTVRAAAREMFPSGGKAGDLGREPPPESPEACEAIRGAEMLARRASCGYVGTEHLLGALALDPGSNARRVLVRLGVSIPDIKKALECYIGVHGRVRRRRRKTAGATCSFCGKPRAEGLRLVAGPGVYICAECVALCNEILVEPAPAD